MILGIVIFQFFLFNFCLVKMKILPKDILEILKPTDQ